MGPYSHWMLAAGLEATLQPTSRSAYDWGAVAPDIRYVANLPRETTHLERGRLAEFAARYPHLRDFLLGYQVHLLIDQVDVSRVVGAAFPLNLAAKVLRKRLSHAQITMLVEMYYLRAGAVTQRLLGEHNEMLTDLGITPSQTLAYQQALQAYFENRTAEAAISAFQKIGLIRNERVEKYRSAYGALQKPSLMQSLLLLSVKNAKLDVRVRQWVLAEMAKRGL